jgi:DNA polymerase III epsilon subunit-like protein
MTDTYISVDIEASGPVPGEYSMLSLGACVVGAVEKNFYVELKPITPNFNPESLAVAGLDLEWLAKQGTAPADAMQAFDAWLCEVTPRDGLPIFAAYPLAFDWMFVAYYFERFLGRNPFGYSGFDVKSYYMGLTGEPWAVNSIARRFPRLPALTHNARQDAIVQAELLSELFEYARKHRAIAET